MSGERVGGLMKRNILPNERKLTDCHFLSSARAPVMKLRMSCVLNELSGSYLKTSSKRCPAQSHIVNARQS